MIQLCSGTLAPDLLGVNSFVYLPFLMASSFIYLGKEINIHLQNMSRSLYITKTYPATILCLSSRLLVIQFLVGCSLGLHS